MGSQRTVNFESNPQDPEDDRASPSALPKQKDESGSPKIPGRRSSDAEDNSPSRRRSRDAEDISPSRRSRDAEDNSPTLAPSPSRKISDKSNYWSSKVLHTFIEEVPDGNESVGRARSFRGVSYKNLKKRRCCKLGGKSKVQKALEKIEMKLHQSKQKVPWVKTQKADAVFGFAIVLGAITVGADLERDADAKIEGVEFWGIWIFESVLLVIFLIEIALRLKADGWLRYLQQPWGWFDIFITFCGCIDAWALTFTAADSGAVSAVAVLRIFRLARLVRLLRLFNIFKELVVLLHVLADSVGAVLWLCLLFLAVVFTSSVLVVVLFKANKESSDQSDELDQYFGSVFRAFFWHFVVATMENWTSIAKVTRKESDWWLLYWVVLIVLLNFVMLNLTVGLMVSRIVRKTQELDKDHFNLVEDSVPLRKALTKLCETIGIEKERLESDTGVLTMRELKLICRKPETLAILDAFGIKVDVPLKFIWSSLHFQGALPCHDKPDMNAEIKFGDFVDAVTNLRGSCSGHDVRTLFVRHDISELHSDMDKRIAKVEQLLRPVLIDVEDPPREDKVSTPIVPPDEAKKHLQEIEREMGALEERQAQTLAKIRNLVDPDHDPDGYKRKKVSTVTTLAELLDQR